MVNNSLKTYVILDNIRSLYNVGAIFRTCDAAGIDKLFLCGITGHPEGGVRVEKKIKKTALGNVESINWQYYKNIKTLLNKLKKENVNIVSIEQANNSRNYKDFKITKDTAFVFGNEIDGVSQKVLNESDHVLHLPMKGKAVSLNVSTAVGIILYHFN